MPPASHSTPLTVAPPGLAQRLVIVAAVLAMVFAGFVAIPAEVDAAAYRATANLNLRTGPGAGFDVIRVIPSGATVDVTGNAENGYLPLTYDGSSGYAAVDWLTSGDGSDDGDGNDGGTASGPTGTRYVIDGRLNLRSGPATSYGVVAVMPEGAAVQLTGQVSNGYVQVSWSGLTGWAYAQYLSPNGPSAPPPSNPTPTPVPPTPTPVTPNAPSAPTIGDTPVGTAVVTTGGLSLNLRSGPGTSHGVVRGMPNGVSVDVMGSQVNGFLPLRYNGAKGWASAQYLRTGSAPAPTQVPPTQAPPTAIPTQVPVTPTPTGGVPPIGDTVVGSAMVTTGGANLYLRTGPGTSYGPVRTIPNAATVDVMGSAMSGYLPVRYAGTKGWSSATYLRVGAAPSPTATPTRTPVPPTAAPTRTPTPTPPPTPVTPTATPVTPTPTTPPTGGGTVIGNAVVSVSTTLNMRSGPGLEHPVVRGLANGTQVGLLGASVNGFRPIRVGGLDGWAHQDYLIVGGTNPGPGTPAPTVPTIGNTAVGKATINGTVWKRTGPGLSYSANEQLFSGRKVEVMGDPYSGWTPIRYNGSKGWVPSSNLDPGWGWTVVGQMVTTRIIPMMTAPGGGTIVIHVGAGSVIDITGAASGKYLPVQWYGRLGWVDGTTLIRLEDYVDPGPANAREAEMIAIIYEMADKWGQSRADFLRVARCESSLSPNAVSKDGAQGLFQFMPGTWAFTPNGKRGENPFDPRASADAAGWMWANGMRHHWMCA